jgi:hypothetical protein
VEAAVKTGLAKDSGSYELDGSGRIMEQGQQIWSIGGGGGTLVEPTFEVGKLGPTRLVGTISLNTMLLC